MPRDLYAEDRLVDMEEALQRGEILAELDLLLGEQTVFQSPGWRYFKARLESIENDATETLINQDTDPSAARARVKLARHLLNVEGEIRARVAELRAKLEGPMEEYDE